MSSQIQCNVPDYVYKAIQQGIEEKLWNSKYDFVSQMATEKVKGLGLISFIHYHCQTCSREVYVLPEIVSKHDWLYCTVCNKKEKKDGMTKLETVLERDIPNGSEKRE